MENNTTPSMENNWKRWEEKQ